MGKLKGVKKITTISILIALSVVFSYFDSLVSMGMLSIAPVLVAVFYEFRIGLANIVILIIILNFSFRDALLSAVLKSLLVGLFLWELCTKNGDWPWWYNAQFFCYGTLIFFNQEKK